MLIRTKMKFIKDTVVSHNLNSIVYSSSKICTRTLYFFWKTFTLFKYFNQIFSSQRPSEFDDKYIAAPLIGKSFSINTGLVPESVLYSDASTV